MNGRRNASGEKISYRLILATGLRRDELRQLTWGDVKLSAPMPRLQLRAETTKDKRADVLPIRKDIAALLEEARVHADNGDRVFRTLASMDSHKRYLTKAGILYDDEQGRRADIQALRHTSGACWQSLRSRRRSPCAWCDIRTCA